MRKQMDGVAIDLTPESRQLVATGGGHPAPTIFVASGRSLPDHRAFWPQVAALLTGLSSQKLSALGGYEVVDVTSGDRIFSA